MVIWQARKAILLVALTIVAETLAGFDQPSLL